jgi:hypothetical protein
MIDNLEGAWLQPCHKTRKYRKGFSPRGMPSNAVASNLQLNARAVAFLSVIPSGNLLLLLLSQFPLPLGIPRLQPWASQPTKPKWALAPGVSLRSKSRECPRCPHEHVVHNRC